MWVLGVGVGVRCGVWGVGCGVWGVGCWGVGCGCGWAWAWVWVWDGVGVCVPTCLRVCVLVVCLLVRVRACVPTCLHASVFFFFHTAKRGQQPSTLACLSLSLSLSLFALLTEQPRPPFWLTGSAVP